MDWQKEEDEMLLIAGRAGGEYLEEIKKSDLAKLTKDQWLLFLRCVVGRWVTERAEYQNGPIREKNKDMFDL